MIGDGELFLMSRAKPASLDGRYFRPSGAASRCGPFPEN